MAGLSARFKLIDEMSDRLGSIAESGQNIMDKLERIGGVSSSAFGEIESGAGSVVSSVDGVATSIENASESTDHWTDAADAYSKSALEAIYSTEELVEMGLKSSDALEEQAEVFAAGERAAENLSESIEAAGTAHEELSSAMSEAASVAEELSENENVSAETKAALAEATVEATEAMNNLLAAQEEASAAMEAYDEVIASGTTDLDTLESAAERAGHAAETLAEANSKASEATEELSRATEEASEEAEKGGEAGTNAIETIAGALAAAGIVAKVKEIAEAAYELADAYSESSKIIVNATGATGEALDGLGQSMLKAYAANDDGLADTAAAVGELNTRMGLTGDDLTEVTHKFMDFADVTNGNAASSVRSVTQLMRQWNVPADEMYSLLDRLTYAGQASGISVDTLTSQLTTNKAILDQLGFSLDEATAMFMQFELAGTNSTAVMTGLRTALSKGAVSSLDELYEVFDQISSGAMNAADASEMFGSRAGPAIVDAVNSGVLSLDDMVAALENSEGVMDTTAEAGESLAEKWQKASNNIGTAFTSAMEPALTGMSSALAGVVDGIGTFLNEHPAVTKAITAIGVGLGVVVTGFALYTAGQAVATAATALFGTTLSAAIWPITAIAAAVAAVTAAVLFLVDAFQEDMGATEGMTAATREQYYELEDLNAEYEEACEKYGETSEEALRLKYEVDDLSAAFEQNRQTVEEFTAEVDAMVESVGEISDAFDSAMTDIQAQETGTLALIQKYQDLSSQASLTAAQEKQLEAVNQQLAESYPELSAMMDDASISTDDYVAAMKRACEQEAEEARQQQARQTYVEALQKQAELTDEIAKAQENLNLEQARMDEMSGWDHFWTGGEWDDLNAYQEALDELQAAEAENNALIAEIEQGWADVADAEAEAAEAPMAYEEAAATAYESVREKVEELCAAYDEAYEAAYESFQGQFGLFDEAEADMDATVANAQAALDSQLAYWESYGANIETLKNTSAADLGITQENYDALMSYAQSGSEEAAGLAASMAQAIADGDTEAVAALADTLGKVNEQQNAIAQSTADWQTNFTEQMNGYQEEMVGIINDMDLSDEARTSATETVNSYASAIRAGKSGAVAAAQEVANAVTAALSSANTTVNVKVNSSTPGHALGTTNAESVFVAGEHGPELVSRPAAAYATGTTNSDDYFIAGENGPELIVGAQGSTVFPTSETDRLISALNEKRQPLQVIYGGGNDDKKQDAATEQVKRILLEVAGSGTIEVNGGTDKATILEILTQYLKPVLMSIIQNEIYEEGELSYEY